jgi:hypothetical protein
MKTITKIALSIFTITVGAMIFTTGIPQANSYSNAAPSGKTGSPADGATCNSCHSGATVPFIPGLITSTIPVTGYVPGATYTITGTIIRPGHTKFGFQISPQNSVGTKLGSIAITSSQTQIVGLKYITHTSSGTSGSGSKSWSFNWVAPAAGTGVVTFYGAFNATNSDGNGSGDSIFTSKLTVAENFSTGLSSLSEISKNITTYPNPVTDQLHITNALNSLGEIQLSIIDINGRLVKSVANATVNSTIDVSDLARGNYMLKIDTEKGAVIKKIIKN